MNWHRVPPYEILPDTLLDFTPSVWVKLSKAERDILCHFLGYMAERLGKSNYHHYISQEGRYLPLGGYFDGVYDELLAKLSGDIMTEAKMIAMQGLKSGMTDCDCEKNKLAGAEKDYTTLTPVEFDIKCRKLTLLYDVVVGTLTEIVAMHDKMIEGLDGALIASGSAIALGALLAPYSGGLTLIPVGIIAAVLYLYEQQVLVSLLVRDSWANSLNYVQTHKCELINIMMHTNSAMTLRNELLGELEDILQMFSMPAAAWGKVLFAELAPNSLFAYIFDFAEDVAIASISCGCTDENCYYEYATTENLTNVGEIRQVLISGEIVPAVSVWSTFVVHQAHFYPDIGSYRMDIVRSALPDGQIVTRLEDVRVEVLSVFDGALTPPIGQPTGGMWLDVGRDYFGAPVQWEPNHIIDSNVNCLYRHNWSGRVLSFASGVNFRVKFGGTA